MSHWFQKENSRRFYRIDMPMKVFILPKYPIQDKEIYATGADYFPSSLQKKIIHQKEKTLNWSAKVQENTVIIGAIFKEFFEVIEFLSESLELVTKGHNPKNDGARWWALSLHKKGFQKIIPLKKQAPKTYQYFKIIEEKYLTLLNSFVKSINSSTPTRFEADTLSPHDLKIDRAIEQISRAKSKKIPLIEALKNLSKYLDIHIHLYRQITQDHYLKNSPQEWKMSLVNISSGGIKIALEKNFLIQDKVNIYLYFAEKDKVLHFEGSAIRSRIINKDHKEQTSFNFEFPGGYNQNFLQTEIELYEIKECMELNLQGE